MLQSKSERLKQFQENLQKRVKEATKAHRRFMAESQNIKVQYKSAALECRENSNFPNTTFIRVQFAKFIPVFYQKLRVYNCMLKLNKNGYQ